MEGRCNKLIYQLTEDLSPPRIYEDLIWDNKKHLPLFSRENISLVKYGLRFFVQVCELDELSTAHQE